MSNAIAIADAIASELNNAAPETFSQDFTALRRIIPGYELSELAELKVTVVPASVEITGSTRATSQYDFAIDIGIQKKVSRDEEADVPPLMQLVEEIATYLSRRALSNAPWAVWVGLKNEPIYDPGQLKTQRVFTSLLTLTYRAMK